MRNLDAKGNTGMGHSAKTQEDIYNDRQRVQKPVLF
jgi:hypothetical protein